MDIFKLSRDFFDWSFENPEKITPTHSAIYFFAIEHCNRLWWKEKFWFPTSMAMEAIWIRKWETYNKAFRNLVEWWFIKEIEKSRNQYSSCIISIWSATPKNGKALDKALVKHGKKHSVKHSESTGVIDIQETSKQETRVKDFSIDEEIINNFIIENNIWLSRKLFFEFLIKRNKKWKIKQDINIELINKINNKLLDFKSKLWESRTSLEIEKFIEYHNENDTQFDSVISRLNTWLSNLLK